MENQKYWGPQIGGIQGILHSTGTADELERLSADQQDRIDDFLKRHGGPEPTPRRHQRIDGGYRGCLEIYAADGYVLRIEWSRSELRGTMNISELSSVA
jgi:hypothetical protein